MSTPPDNVYFGKSGVTYNLNTNTESSLQKRKKKKTFTKVTSIPLEITVPLASDSVGITTESGSW